MTDDLPDDWWTVAHVATYLGVATSTLRAYVARGQMPLPDRRLGRKMWLWRPTTIMRWDKRRKVRP